MNERALSRVTAGLGLCVAAVAFVVYVFTLSVGAYPGGSAALVAQRLGVAPVMGPSHPVWETLAWVMLRIPIGDAVARLNLLSALFGGLSVWFLYRLVVGAIEGCVLAEDHNQARAWMAARIAGVAAGLALAFCTPFWVASTRALPATLDICLLLVSAWLLVQYLRKGSGWLVPLFGSLYGVGVVESATFIVFAPVFGICILFLMWKKSELLTRPVLRLILATLAGLLLYFLMAWRFYGSPGYVWREYSGYWQVVWSVWRDQYFLITRSLPQRGWLLVLIMAVVPWLTAVGVAKRALNEERDWTYYVLHLIITGLTVAVLLNAKLAPWPMLGENPLLVTPYVLTASVFGYLAAYWFLLPGAWRTADAEGVRRWLAKWLGWIFLLPFLTVLLAAPIRNLTEADGRPAAVIREYAKVVVNTLGSRTWLVTDGVLDNHLLIAARDARRTVHLVNLHAGDNAVYLRYVASQLEGVRLKNLAQIGLLPLIKGILSASGSDSRVAVLTAPDLWTAVGRQIVPCKMMFFGPVDRASLNPADIMAQHGRFWSEQAPPLKRLAAKPGFIGMLARQLLRSAGLVANDLGVLMEDLGRKEEAFKAYGAARDIDPQNVSALLNMDVMVKNGWAAENAADIRSKVETLAAQSDASKAPLWSLVRNYGYVRMPEAFASRGWTWVLSGQPGLAVSELEKAMDLSTDSTREAVQQLLAGAYMAEEKPDQSEELYRELLAGNPSNFTAAVGMARIAAGRRDFLQAHEWLRQASTGGAPREQVEMETITLLRAEGKTAEATEALRKLLETNPDNLRAEVLLADALLRSGDEAALASCLARMERLSGSEGFVAATRAAMAAAQEDWEGARNQLKIAVDAMPNNLVFQERLLTLDLMLHKEDQAEADMRGLLKVDPESAIGNYVMGTLHLRDGDTDLAEDSFRTSLRRKRTPGALNDLAWLLTGKGAYVEAEKLAREALKLDPKMATAWDTLGVILTKVNRLPDAQKVIEYSLKLDQGDAVVFLHLAEIQVLKGDMKRARELIDMLNGKISRLSPKDQEQLNALARQVEDAAARARAKP